MPSPTQDTRLPRVSTMRLVPGIPAEVVVHDEPTECPYLPDRVARLPMRLPIRPLGRDELDVRLAAGDRRQGMLLYRPSCPACEACEAIRVDVAAFRPGRTQRRVLARGERRLRVELGPPVADERRVELYNLHRAGRGLATGPPIDVEAYRAFLGLTCCDSFELRYHDGESLVGVALTDRSSSALSAVYCFYDPACERLSPGTFSILQQIELCRRWELPWLYLGLYVSDCAAMKYKARWLPHERRIDGVWQRFER